MSTPTDIRGLHLGSLSVLSPILKHWQQLNVAWKDGDVPWWYNERASVGILAGAIWKYGGDWILEEFGATKLAGPRKKKIYSGRCDIAFGVDGQDFWVEAKQCWPNLNGKNTSQTVETNLRVASEQAKSGKQRGYQRLAIVFATPKVKASPANRRQMDNYITSYIEQLKNGISNVTLAWTFPAQARHSRPDNAWHPYYFPGVIMTLLPVK